MSFWTLRQAAETVLGGGVIAYPTEAVFGLGCNPYDAQAVIRLLEIKQRDMAQGLILIGHRLSDFDDFISPLQQSVRDKVMSSWPGPYTWLLPASEQCPYWLTGQHTKLAVRVTAHPQCRALCKKLGMPLVSTSANRHGQHPARSTLQVRRRLGASVDYILPGHTSGEHQPSQIRDAITDQRIR